jgi:rifampicin phosphotransferase
MVAIAPEAVLFSPAKRMMFVFEGGAMNPGFLLPLDSPAVDLDTVGGKGLSLSRLARAGLPVPGGFHLTTAAYRVFVEAAGLQPDIRAALDGLDRLDPGGLEAASARIRAAFERAGLPEEIAAGLRSAYAGLGEEAAVAVRSSATAEDLPEASFAGQQDTFLNVRGAEALLEAVRRCWSSLWSARAIAYRAKNGIPGETAALAVVVQEMVAAESAGILFTANPLNGSRQEMLVNAAWGLGEGIVGGQVSPDVYTLEKASGKLLKAEIADKRVMTVYAAQGGSREQPVPAEKRKARVLARTQLRQLARMARGIEAQAGAPQDIEWAWAGGQFYILQARPVTSLPLCWDPPREQIYYARGSLVEYLPDPLTPLFRTFGVPIANRLTAEMFQKLGLRNMWPDGFYTSINGYLFGTTPARLGDMMSYMGMAANATPKLLKKSESIWREAVDVYRAEVEVWSRARFEEMRAGELLDAARALFSAAMAYYNVFQTTGAPAAGMYEVIFTQLYDRLVRRKGDPEAREFVLGEDNESLRAEKELFDLAGWIREQPELAGWIEATPALELAAVYHGQQAPQPGSETLKAAWEELSGRVAAYNRRYGHMLYDFDFGKRLPGEDVTPLFDAVKAYLAGKGSDPYARQRGVLAQCEALARQTRARLDPLRRRWFDQTLAKARHFGPIREDSIAVMGLSYPLLRRALRELGQRMAGAGAIEKAEEIYWLEAAEVEAAVQALDRGEVGADYKARVPARQARLENLRRAAPPTFLPRDTWMSKFLPWKENNTLEDGVLKGLGTSGGTATGRARVLLRPEDFNRMRSGDVLVAPTTTPAWTALFTLACAVVTDIGGPLSHSSIVAREYGIPAVMATGSATRLIRDGQLVTVDGNAGTVRLYEEGEN